ncbi:MAG: hypothetical protein IJ461_04085 [Clostridia bacterium]|nr:hypothetical protein [Clostridia bacterium]
MDPFAQTAPAPQTCFMDWKALYPSPYLKQEVDPYTRTRVILMNGTEFEANWFLHQFSRHCANNDLRRELALLRRLEQQQQKLLSALKPLDESVLEHTIGYEQLAVDLTAHLAQRVTDANVKQALDFALLEDFDHLYRYADLLDMDAGVKAENLVGRYTEIMPGRPTIAEHRFPYDDVKNPISNKQADTFTKLACGIITAAEQQTMNYYMNVCALYPNTKGRRLYQEIAMIEEQHVTQYGCLMDPTATWLECLVMHQYTEAYLYWSCMETEPDQRMKKVWQQLYEQELVHLKLAAELLEKYEHKDYRQVVGEGSFPQALVLGSNIDYVRGVLAASVEQTGQREGYRRVDELPPKADFFQYQQTMNHDVPNVQSHDVIADHIRLFGQDYRWETAPNPIQPLQDRTQDNVEVGRSATRLN